MINDTDRTEFERVWDKLAVVLQRRPVWPVPSKESRVEEFEKARDAYWSMLRELPIEAVREAAPKARSRGGLPVGWHLVRCC